MTEYTRSQIIKHALMYYLEKPDMTEKDKHRVQIVLDKYVDRVQWLKEIYGIKAK